MKVEFDKKSVEDARLSIIIGMLASSEKLQKMVKEYMGWK